MADDPEEKEEEDTTTRLYCDECGEDKDMPFIGEYGDFEVYGCPDCGNERSFAVR